MASSSIQFFGKEPVLKAFTSRGIETWGLCQGKQLIMTGEGVDELTAFLDMLEPGGSAAIYTLKIYNNANAETITDKTDCNGSFNFKLVSLPGAGAAGAVAVGAFGSAAGGSGPVNLIQAKINKILSDELDEVVERKLNGIGKEDKPSFTDTVMGYLDDPERLAQLVPIIQAVGTVIGNIFRPAVGNAGAMLPAAIGATNPPRRAGSIAAENRVSDISSEADETQMRLVNVLNRLEKVDPDILNTLEKLAAMAEKSPQKYQMAKSML